MDEGEAQGGEEDDVDYARYVNAESEVKAECGKEVKNEAKGKKRVREEVDDGCGQAPPLKKQKTDLAP